MLSDLIGICSICKRRHDNVGWSPSERHPVKWLCWECLNDTHNGVRSKLPRIYHMPRNRLDGYEEAALAEAGEQAGAFLDSIGKTDLASLDKDEWSRFLALVLKGYADSMREIVSREVPY